MLAHPHGLSAPRPSSSRFCEKRGENCKDDSIMEFQRKKPSRPNALSVPQYDIDALREMQQRLCALMKPKRIEHGVFFDAGLGGLQRPRLVVNVIAQQRSTRGKRVQAIALCQPVFQGSGSCLEDIANRLVAGAKVSCAAAALRSIRIFPVAFAERHVGAVIRQIEETTRRPHSNRVGSVQTQEPDSGFAFRLNVESDVQFRKSRQSRNVGKWSRRYAGHPEGHNSDPGSASKFLNL
jgi:hypothetical protein